MMHDQTYVASNYMYLLGKINISMGAHQSPFSNVWDQLVWSSLIWGTHGLTKIIIIIIFNILICMLSTLQGFNWVSWKKEGGLYNFLSSQAPALAQAGFTHVWLPPPSQSVSPEGIVNALQIL